MDKGAEYRKNIKEKWKNRVKKGKLHFDFDEERFIFVEEEKTDLSVIMENILEEKNKEFFK